MTNEIASIEEDIEWIFQAIKSENWAYVVRKLPQLNHANQFLMMRSLPVEVLKALHFQLYSHAVDLRTIAHSTDYAYITAVTILRGKDSYPGTTFPRSEEELEMRVMIESAKEKVGL